MPEGNSPRPAAGRSFSFSAFSEATAPDERASRRRSIRSTTNKPLVRCWRLPILDPLNSRGSAKPLLLWRQRPKFEPRNETQPRRTRPTSTTAAPARTPVRGASVAFRDRLGRGSKGTDMTRPPSLPVTTDACTKRPIARSERSIRTLQHPRISPHDADHCAMRYAGRRRVLRPSSFRGGFVVGVMLSARAFPRLTTPRRRSATRIGLPSARSRLWGARGGFR